MHASSVASHFFTSSFLDLFVVLMESDFQHLSIQDKEEELVLDAKESQGEDIDCVVGDGRVIG